MLNDDRTKFKSFSFSFVEVNIVVVFVVVVVHYRRSENSFFFSLSSEDELNSSYITYQMTERMHMRNFVRTTLKRGKGGAG